MYLEDELGYLGSLSLSQIFGVGPALQGVLKPY